MEGYCSKGQSPQWAVVPVEEEEEYHCVTTNYSIQYRNTLYRFVA
jgi:hypothetical protein